VDIPDDLGPREIEVLVAALEVSAAEVLGGEIARLDHGAHGAVEDQDPLGESPGESRALSVLRHALILAHGLGNPQRPWRPPWVIRPV